VEYVIIAVAAIALAVVIIREVVRSRRTEPIRDKQEAEPIRFSTPVTLKRDSAPRCRAGGGRIHLDREKQDVLRARSGGISVLVLHGAGVHCRVGVKPKPGWGNEGLDRHRRDRLRRASPAPHIADRWRATVRGVEQPCFRGPLHALIHHCLNPEGCPSPPVPPWG
jgi:hypothetical protein